MPRYNGYKSVFTNPWLLRQKNRCSIKRLGKYQQREWTHSLFAVPIVRNHLAVVELTPRSKCVYTRYPDLCHATSGVLTSQPPEHAKIGMRVKTLSDRRHNKILRVNTASGANWLTAAFQFFCFYDVDMSQKVKSAARQSQICSSSTWPMPVVICSLSKSSPWLLRPSMTSPRLWPSTVMVLRYEVMRSLFDKRTLVECAYQIGGVVHSFTFYSCGCCSNPVEATV